MVVSEIGSQKSDRFARKELNMNLRKNFWTLLALAAFVGCFIGCSKAAKQARHRTRADRYFQQQEYAKAEVEYMNALRLAPKDPAILRQLGFLFFEQSRMRLAFQALSDAKLRDPQNADVRFRLATLFVQGGEVTNARTEARFVLSQQPTNAQALFVLVDSVRSPADAAEIRREVEGFGAKHGFKAEVHVALAQLDFREGNFAAGEDHLKKAAIMAPESPFVHLSLAKLRLSQTNMAEGEAFLKRAAEAAPVRSSYRLMWAGFKIRTGDLPAARQILKEVTAKAPDYVPAWNLLADIALAEKDYKECEKITASVLKLDAQSYEARLLRARMFLAQDQPAKAVEEFTRLESIYPGLPQAKYHLAVGHLRVGDVGKANAALNQALKLSPGYPEAVVLQAELNLRAGNATVAVTPLMQLLRAHPEHVQAAMLLANAHQAQGRPDEALRVYRELNTRFPKNPQLPLLAGMVLRQQKKLTEARAAFEQSHQIAPGFPPAVEQLINLDLLATNFTAALERCARLGTVLTNSAIPMVLEATVHGARKDLKAAEAALLRGLETDPDSLAAFTLLAGLYNDLKEYDKALARLDGITQRNPKATAAWVQKGMIYQARHEQAKAKEAYQRAIDANPGYAPALNNLAYILSEEPGKLNEAFALATRARQAAPAQPSIADTLGWVNYKRRNFIAARALFAETAEKLDVAEIHYHLGLADYALANEQSARQSLEKAIKGNLDPKLREDATTRLAILNLEPTSATSAQVAQVESVVERDSSDYLAQLRLGLVYQRQNSFEKARAAFEAASRANPQSSLPLLRLARLQTGRDNARAFEIAKSARKLDPNNSSVALVYGTLALQNRDYSAALVALQEALNAPESSPETAYALAVAQYAMGQTTRAIATLQGVAAAGPGASGQSARDALTLMNSSSVTTPQRLALAETRLKSDRDDFIALVSRAEIDEQQGLFKEAVSRYKKVIELSPNFWPAHRRLAFLYAERLKDDKSALPHATKARQASPDDAVTAHVLGKIAFRRNEFPSALRYFQESATGTLTTGEPHYLVGLTCLRLSRTNDSKAALTKALEMPLPPDIAREAKRLLAELN